MYAVTSTFLDAIRGPHNAYGYVEAWRGGVKLTLDDGAVLPVADDGTRLPLVDGQVQVDGATPGVRRTLTVRLAPTPGLWDLLAPVGTELRAYTVLRYLDGSTETVPQGVFDIDVQRMGYAANGDLQITAPDLWVRVQRARFLTPRASTAGNSTRLEIATLLLEALPAGTSVIDVATSTATVPAQTWDRDRDKAIQDMAKAASLDVYMGRDGSPVIRDAPALSASPVWTVDAGAEGVLVDADRERNRQRTYNVVVVNSTSAEAAFATRYVWDNNPDSPTYAGPGAGVGVRADVPAPSSAGPFGQRPFFYSSPLLTDVGQALAAGQTILDRVTGLAAQLTLSAVSNPALDDGDTILVRLPKERRDLPRPVERHIVDSMTVPLVPSKNAQRIDTRSTMADVDEGA